MKKTSYSPETQKEAEAIAKATQKPNQTKEQTKLIAKGIEHGIAEYKKRQKEKQRQFNKEKKRHQQKVEQGQQTMEQPQLPEIKNKSSIHSWLGYVLFALSLLWIAFQSNSAQAAQNSDTKMIEQSDLVYMQTSEGLVIIQVLPHIAPNHAERFKNLVKEGFYDDLSFYRVVDGFVAQAGEGEDEGRKESKYRSELKGEFTRKYTDNSLITVVQSPEFLAPETGYIDSVPAGRDPNTKEEWFLHCPGLVSMARSTEADTGTTEFYINIGQAPRHLDRNMSSFGRVIYGLEFVQKMQRGPKEKAA